MKSILGSRPYTFDRVFRIIARILIVFGIFWLVDYFLEVLAPFLVALVLAYLLNPMIALYQRAVKRRLTALLLTMITVVASCAVVGGLTISLVESQAHQMAFILKRLQADPQFTDELRKVVPEGVVNRIQDAVAQPAVQEFLDNPSLSTLIFNLGEMSEPRSFLTQRWEKLGFSIMFFALMLFYLFFILKDFEKFVHGCREFIPGIYLGSIDTFMHDFNTAMGTYFRAQFVVAMINAAIYAVGFSWIGLPLAIMLGLMVGLLHMVPYLNMIALIPVGLLGLMQGISDGKDITTILIQIALVFAAVQILQDFFTYPYIMGHASGLSPIVVLLSLSIWGKLLGAPGLVIAIPVTCLVVAWYKQLLKKWDTDNLSSNADEGIEDLSGLSDIPKKPGQTFESP